MKGTSIALSSKLTACFISKTVKVQIDKAALTRTLAASAIMAIVILIIQQILYDNHLLPLYILVGAATCITLIKTLNVLDDENSQFLRQTIGKRAAKYALRILS